MVFAQIKDVAEIGTGIAREFGVIVAILIALIALMFISAYIFFRYILVPVKDAHIVYLRETGQAYKLMAEFQRDISHKQDNLLREIGTVGERVDRVDEKVDGLTGRVDSISRRIAEAPVISEERVRETQRQLRDAPRRKPESRQ